MEMPMKKPAITTMALSMLALLMASHMAFLGLRSDKPAEFQRAAETYITLLLALLTPINTMK